MRRRSDLRRIALPAALLLVLTIVACRAGGDGNPKGSEDVGAPPPPSPPSPPSPPTEASPYRTGARKAGGVRARAPFVEFEPFDGPKLEKLDRAIAGRPENTLGFAVEALREKAPPKEAGTVTAIDNAGELFALALAEELAHLGWTAVLAGRFRGLDVPTRSPKSIEYEEYLVRVLFSGKISLYVAQKSDEDGYATVANLDLDLDAKHQLELGTARLWNTALTSSETVRGASARDANRRAKKAVAAVIENALRQVLADKTLDQRLAELVARAES